ncbi:MAG: hypothetical protein HY098_01830 [Nitrospinae bacterium]|nr:hypothetical protein [Nitrospinota bacterium]
MSGEFNERNIEGFLLKHRPHPPSPQAGEYKSLLLAAGGGSVVKRGEGSGKTYRFAFALAAGILIALGVTLNLRGHFPPAVTKASDEQLEAFLDETVRQVTADPPPYDTNAPNDEIEGVGYDNER